MSRCASVGLLVLCACRPIGIDDDGGETDTEGMPDYPAPVIVEPLDEISIPVTRADDLVLEVADVTLGVTRLLLDGQSVGSLGTDDRIGTLTSNALTLRLTGALVESTHTIRLRTVAGAEPVESRELALRIAPAPTSSPTATVGDDVVLRTDAIFATGYDDEGLLVAVDLQPTTAPVAAVYRAAGTGWDLDAPVGLTLDGLHVDETPRSSVHAHLGTVGDEERVRVVWRAGIEADSIVVADSPWVEPRPMPREILEVKQIAGSAEYARLGRPLLLGDEVVVEALIASDVEHPRPGDFTLVTVRIAGSPLDAGAPQLATLEGRVDIDELAPTIDILERVGGPHTFAARVGGMRPVVFTVDRDSGELASRLSLANDEVSLLADLALPMVTVLGALDSRQIFAPLHGGAEGARVLLRHFDDGESNGATDASPTTEQLAGIGDPTAEAVATLVRGAPIYLVPMGVDAPAYAFVSTGPSPLVVPIEGLRCDEIAVPVTTEANHSGTTSLACRRGRDVSLGTLTLP